MNYNHVYQREDLRSPAEMQSSSRTLPTQQPQPQPQQHHHPLNAVRKTMSTMETLGIRLPPPGYRAQDTTPATTTTTTTTSTTWRHDAVPNVQIISPNTTYPQSYEQQPYASLSASYAQFQPGGSDHFDECGLSYTPTLSGHDDDLLDNIDDGGDDSQLLVSNYTPYTVPCHRRDEHYYYYPAMPGSFMTGYPEMDSESLYPFDYYNDNNVVFQHAAFSSSSGFDPTTMIRPLTADEMNLPGFSATSYCDPPPYNGGGLEESFVPNSTPSVSTVSSSHVQVPTFDMTKEFRQSYESQHPAPTNKRLATENPSTGSPHVSKRPRISLTPCQEDSSAVHQPVRSAQRRNEGSSKLAAPSTNPPISRPTQSPQPYQQSHQLAPPFLLPSNADSSGVPMKPIHSPMRRTTSTSPSEGHKNAENSKKLHTNLSKPPDLLGPLFEEQESPPLRDMNPDDPEMIPHKQNLRFDNDLYTPRWVRGHGNKREGWCGICKPGRWLVLKNSAFWYDKSFSHGVSAVTGRAFEGPKSIRRIKRIKSDENSADINNDNRGTVVVPTMSRFAAKTTTTWEGLCGSCDEWIALVSSKKKGTTWFRHAYRCQSQFKAREGLPSPLPSTSG